MKTYPSSSLQLHLKSISSQLVSTTIILVSTAPQSFQSAVPRLSNTSIDRSLYPTFIKIIRTAPSCATCKNGNFNERSGTSGVDQRNNPRRHTLKSLQLQRPCTRQLRNRQPLFPSRNRSTSQFEPMTREI
jgi:hypothetical protein